MENIASSSSTKPMTSRNNEWDNANAIRAEQIAHLARYATLDMPNYIEIAEQHTVVHTLYVQVEHIQCLVHKFEGYPFQWNALNSYKRFNRELTLFRTGNRTMAELEIVLAKRKELIRDIVYNLTWPITRVSIEMERQKLLALAHMGKELLPLITLHTETMRRKMAKQQQQVQQTQETHLTVVEESDSEPLNLTTHV